MGCFPPCMGAFKHRKSRNKLNILPSRDQRHGSNNETLQVQATQLTKQQVLKNIQLITVPKDKHEEQLDGSIRKKVTFDLNIKTHEEISTQKIKICLLESDNGREREKTEEPRNESQNLSDSSASSAFSYHPPSHGYHNFSTCDDESEDIEVKESDSDDNDDEEEEEDDDVDRDGGLAEGESYESSLFSLSIESRKQVSVFEMDEKDEEVNRPMIIRETPIGLNQSGRDGRKYEDSVLEPVEYVTTQCRKAMKARLSSSSSTSLKDLEKKENMNINLEREDYPSFKPSNRIFEPKVNEIGVDSVKLPIGMNQSGGDGRKYVESVLKPVENLTRAK